MPVSSRKTQDGTAATKPSSRFGVNFCRDRPLFGRAGARVSVGDSLGNIRGCKLPGLQSGLESVVRPERQR